MKKKICLLLISLICILRLLPTVSAATTSGSVGDIAWIYDEQTTTLTISGKGEVGTTSYPPWRDVGKTCTKIIAEEGITNLGRCAFSGFSNVTSVSLPSTLTKIDDYGFDGCSALVSIEIPSSVKAIGNMAFRSCSRLTDISLPNGMQSLDSSVFSGCTSLKSIVIPDSLSEIKSTAFSGCTGLSSVTIGAGVKTIHSAAFNNCTSLKAFTLSSSNTAFSIDSGILYTKDRSKLVLAPFGFSGSYSILPGTKTVGKYSFADCAGLTAVTIPDSVTLLEENAFEDCSALKTVKLGTGLENIQSRAFSLCGALESITLPASLRNVETDAFYFCTGLNEIVFLGDKPIFEPDCFYEVTATCYHPDNETWKNLKNYGGSLTWKATDCSDNHTVETLPAQEATCTTAGKTEGSYCSRCKTQLKAQTVIPAHHDFGSWVEITAATAETEGLAQRTCRKCGQKEEWVLPKGATLPKEDEDISEGTTAATTPEEQPPSQPDRTTPEETTIATAPSAQPGSEKKSPIIWLVVGIVSIALLADAVVGIIYFKKKKQKK